MVAISHFFGLVLASGIASVYGVSTKPHDQIVGFPEDLKSAETPSFQRAYQLSKPFLKVTNGCVPFPAVDADGFVR